MGTAILFAALAVLCGLAVTRVFRAPATFAPFSGLAAIAVLTTWSANLGVPGAVPTIAVVVLTGAGAVNLGWTIRAHRSPVDRATVALLGGATLVPMLLLGVALAGLDAPVSTHDGAFHVETIDNLRRDVAVSGWYPMGFHASVAAVLRLVPWVDSARGTADAAQALAILAPFGIFSLGLAIGLKPRLASLGALVLALTYIYPYDDHMWGGWPLAMSLVLLMGLWSIAARWIAEPRLGVALLGGLVAGAIVLTHGTEVYSSVIGLAVIVALNWRRIQIKQLVAHVPAAALLAAVCVAPYLTALLGWAAGGGASAVGAATLDDGASPGQATVGGGDWLEFVLSVTGSASLIDLPVRVALLAIGACDRRLRVAVGGWLAFTGLLFAVSFLDVPPVRALYVVTFPWLVHHRPPQMVVMFTSMLVGAGLFTTTVWFASLRPRLAGHAGAWRRLAILTAALLFFFAEGSAVTIYKTLEAVISTQYVYSADDRAAMGWLRTHAQPGEMVINDAATDAGIWAPYKANVPILLPRSAGGALVADRAPILSNLLVLDEDGSLATRACALHADYVFAGSRPVPDDTPVLPARSVLEHAPALEEVFASGDAAVFRTKLGCDQG